jgi:hypothetical protein
MPLKVAKQQQLNSGNSMKSDLLPHLARDLSLVDPVIFLF